MVYALLIIIRACVVEHCLFVRIILVKLVERVAITYILLFGKIWKIMPSLPLLSVAVWVYPINLLHISSGRRLSRWQQTRNQHDCISKNQNFCVRMAVVSMVIRHGRVSVPNATERSTRKRRMPRCSMIPTSLKLNSRFIHAMGCTVR